MKRSLLAAAALMCMVSAAPAAQFYGTVDFNDGTVGALSKTIAMQSPITPQVVYDFGGPGLSLNLNGGLAGSGFKSTWQVIDSSAGAGDVYGDVTVKALYMPSANWERALGVRLQANGTGWGIWCSAGTNGWGNFSIIQQTTDFSTAWPPYNRVPFTVATDKWYEITLSAIGQNLTASMTEVGNPTNTVSTTYFAGSAMAPTGMVGTGSAQNPGDPGYLIDNFQVTPEPMTMALLALGGLVAARRRA